MIDSARQLNGTCGILVDTTERTVTHGLGGFPRMLLTNLGDYPVHYGWATGVTACVSPLTTTASTGKSPAVMPRETIEIPIPRSGASVLYLLASAGSNDVYLRGAMPADSQEAA